MGGYVVANSSGNSSTAIALSGNRSGIIVRGGLLSGWTNLLSESAGDADTHVLLEDVRFSGSAGILAPGGRGFTVRRVALRVGGAGIEVGDWARVEGCDVLALSSARSGDGIAVGANSRVSDSRVESGSNGITGGEGTIVVGSIVDGSGAAGIEAPFGSRVHQSVARSAGGTGIDANAVSHSTGTGTLFGIKGANVDFSSGQATGDSEAVGIRANYGISYSFGFADRTGISSELGNVTGSYGFAGVEGIIGRNIFNSVGTVSTQGTVGIAALNGVLNSVGIGPSGIGGQASKPVYATVMNSYGEATADSSVGILGAIVTSSRGHSQDASPITATVGVGSFGIIDEFGTIGGMDIDYPYNVPTLSAP